MMEVSTMKWQASVLSMVVALVVGACGGSEAPADRARGDSTTNQANTNGTGLVLNSVTGLTLPLIGKLGDVNINQAVVTNFALVENTVGQIVGLQADGVLQLTGGVLGTNVVTQNFTTTVSVTSSGPGQCNLVSIDLGQIAIDTLAANVDVPAATLTGQGSGAVGSLLCNLGNLLSGLTSGTGGTAGLGGIVNALNNLI
jgi:hypothetical protein